MQARPGLLLRWGLRHHLRQPLRSSFAVLGIALGTALLLGIQSALHSATAAFEAAATRLGGSATHTVLGGPDGVPAAALGAIAVHPGVRAAAPVSEGLLREEEWPRRLVRFFGCDPLAEAGVRPDFAGAPASGLPLAALLVQPGAFVATRTTLQRLETKVGSTLTLRLVARPLTAHCVGEIPEASGLDEVLVVDIATAQEWNDRPAHVDRVDLVLADEAVAAKLGAALAPALRVEPVASRAAFADLTAAFRTNLQAVAGLSLLVGAFLVHAAMRAAVAGRQVEYALLRALGAPALRIGSTVAIEAAALGLLGSVLGCVLGIGAAQLLVDPLVGTLNLHYATFAVRGVQVEPALLAGAVLLGTLVAVAAALWPAREAAAAPPRAVFVSGHLPPQAAPLPSWWLVPAGAAGIALLAVAERRVWLAHAGLLLLLLVVAVLAPRAVAASIHGAARLLVRMGPWAAYLARSAAASRHRTGSAVAALVLAVATTIGLGMMIASFRTSVAVWLEQALPADVYVAVPSRHIDARRAAVMAPEVEQAVRQLPGVAAATSYRRLRLDVAQGDGPPLGTDGVAVVLTPRALATLPVLGDAEAVRAQFGRGEGALASEPLAHQRGLRPGDELRVFTDASPRSLRLLGIFRDYGSARGVLMLPAAWLGERAVTSLALEAAPGESAATVEDRAFDIAVSAPHLLAVTSQTRLKAQSLSVFDRTFAITAAMRLLCIGVAVLGIWGAFAALQHDRLAEVGLLRALGAGPRHVAGLVLGQTTLLGAAAGLLALPVGAGLGWVLVHVVNRGSFGWTLLTVELPLTVALEGLGLSVLAAFVAGLGPARRLMRTLPAAALRES